MAVEGCFITLLCIMLLYILKYCIVDVEVVLLYWYTMLFKVALV